MEEEHLAALRRWGDGLRLDAREEVRAAGKAIILLCAEVERLELERWQLRTRPASREGPHAGDLADRVGDRSVGTDDAETELKARLRRLLTAVTGR